VKFVTLLLRLSEAATLVTAAMDCSVIRWRLLLLLMAEREMASATDRASDRTSERASEGRATNTEQARKKKSKKERKERRVNAMRSFGVFAKCGSEQCYPKIAACEMLIRPFLGHLASGPLRELVGG